MNTYTKLAFDMVTAAVMVKKATRWKKEMYAGNISKDDMRKMGLPEDMIDSMQAATPATPQQVGSEHERMKTVSDEWRKRIKPNAHVEYKEMANPKRLSRLGYDPNLSPALGGQPWNWYSSELPMGPAAVDVMGLKDVKPRNQVTDYFKKNIVKKTPTAPSPDIMRIHADEHFDTSPKRNKKLGIPKVIYDKDLTKALETSTSTAAGWMGVPMNASYSNTVGGKTPTIKMPEFAAIEKRLGLDKARELEAAVMAHEGGHYLAEIRPKHTRFINRVMGPIFTQWLQPGEGADKKWDWNSSFRPMQAFNDQVDARRGVQELEAQLIGTGHKTFGADMLKKLPMQHWQTTNPEEFSQWRQFLGKKIPNSNLVDRVMSSLHHLRTNYKAELKPLHLVKEMLRRKLPLP